jgi:2-oxoglutarate dehydrogenase E2 component (dihydrolipoamide succinyltransferase)
MATELKIPSAGESITEVQIGRWLKAVGDYVQQDEPVVEIETDKASMELPAPAAGRIDRLVHDEGDIVKVGATIAVIDETAKAEAHRPTEAATPPRTASPSPAVPASEAPAGAARIMPAARRALAGAHLPATGVTPTGPGGRLLKEDVQRGATQAPRPAGSAAVSPAPPAEAAGGPRGRPAEEAGASAAPGARGEEAVPMTMLRRRIAQRLVEACQTMAMLTTFNEIDLSAVQRLRQERSAAFEAQYGIKLGLMSFFVKAAIDALQLVPQANAEIRGTDIVFRNYYDIGIAVSTDAGLVVPVIRSAERLSFAEVEQTIADLATRARERKVTVEELQGGTFTITNGGVFGSLLSTPIINPPQSAILGLHVIQDRPVVRDGQIVVRPMMYVALTYDHRLIDGRESVTFLKRIKECIEEPARMLVEV